MPPQLGARFARTRRIKLAEQHWAHEQAWVNGRNLLPAGEIK